MGGGGSELTVGVQAGDILAGKYRIDKVLGAGGMGVVVAAHHIRLDERVAIKFLLPETLGNAEAVARFEREARAAVKIKSEHVARVTDVGTLETGAPYMVMEYLEGGDLSAWVQQRGALPVEQAVEFLLQACDAIGDAHSLGIVHRDLKPANLFCIQRNDGFFSIKVLDFGISKMTGLAGSGPDMGMTKTTAVMGSPYYMSPEQVQSSRNVDPRSDIWSLGIILHELLTGQVPFGGETIAELVLKIMTAPLPPLRQARPDAPEGLEAVISRCLEKDRARRYSNVAELAVALAPFGPKRVKGLVERITRVIQAAGLSASALALLPSSDSIQPAAAATVAAGTDASWGQTKPEPGRKREMILAVAAGASLAAIAAVAVTVFALRRPAAPDNVATVVTVNPPATPVVAAAAPGPVTTTQVTPPPSPSPTAVPSASAAVPAPPKPAAAPAVPAAAAAKHPAATPPKPAEVSCDPPYTIDGSGHRQYKPECLR